MRVKSPQYLAALADVRAAKEAHAAARGALDVANYRNEKWTSDLKALQRSGKPILTAEQVQERGDGSGVETLYHPFTDRPPFSDLDLERMADTIAETGQRITYCESVVNAMVEAGNYDLDPWDGDHRFVWWPLTNTAADWQGRPLTESDLAKLDHSDLQWHLKQGTIRERVRATV